MTEKSWAESMEELRETVRYAMESIADDIARGLGIKR